MAFEMPLDQIRQLQMLLRKEANLSWYQPENEDHFTLPKLPSVSETIAKLDPSPPYLRCKNCNGRLLRDLQSSICIFCGTSPHKDLPPDPIKFKNTIGYSWLLESLQLDGSEMVAPMAEENASNRGKNASQDEIPLSELVDFEIRWSSQAERLPSGSNSNVSPFQGKNSLNLVGLDLDSFFVQRETESISGSQVGTASDNTFQANENLSLFQNVEASEVATGSTKDQSHDSFSSWEANFKSASSGPVHEEPKSVDNSAVVVESVSGSWKDSIGGKNDDWNLSASTENDWFQGDRWKTSNSEVPSQSGKSELSLDLNDRKTVEGAHGSSTRNLDWMQNDQWQGSDNKTTDSVATDEAADSFDEWNDFTGSASAQDPSSVISSSKITGQTGNYEITADLNDEKTGEGSSSSYIENFDWMKDAQWQDSNTKTTDTMSTNEAVDSLACNDFTGSTNTQYSSSNVSKSEINGQTGKFESIKDPNDIKGAESATGLFRNFDWIQDDQWQVSNNKASDIVKTDDVGDSFDAWNDFTGSAIVQKPSSSVSHSDITDQSGKSEITANLNDTKTIEGVNTASIKDFDWMQVGNGKKTDSVSGNELADPFDIWNGFTSLAPVQDLSSNVGEQTVNQTSSAKMTSEMNLLNSSNKMHNIYFGGFSQHDVFSGQFSGPQSSPGATNAHWAASSSRVADVDAMRGNSGDTSTSKLASKVDDVEMLMSQMHDLSFMLESNLSVPPK